MVRPEVLFLEASVKELEGRQTARLVSPLEGVVRLSGSTLCVRIYDGSSSLTAFVPTIHSMRKRPNGRADSFVADRSFL